MALYFTLKQKHNDINSPLLVSGIAITRWVSAINDECVIRYEFEYYGENRQK